MNTRYDVRPNSSGFQEGDLVWLYNPVRSKGRSPKLQNNWEVPFTVIKRINDVVYRIQMNPRSKLKVVYLDRLTPYRGARFPCGQGNLPPSRLRSVSVCRGCSRAVGISQPAVAVGAGCGLSPCHAMPDRLAGN
ncbi:hypothetical protein NQ318_006682 [Aromia moschata]|uniref:Integrase p58-like C-terminal domain-containing protein n=1 Tax=Aromia moschata TaxID=1265417 RepID=A0AAV8YSN0_9CUCU|nr:hypothetical protein NQ318_006682 [Aromia moschata]